MLPSSFVWWLIPCSVVILGCGSTPTNVPSPSDDAPAWVAPAERQAVDQAPAAHELESSGGEDPEAEAVVDVPSGAGNSTERAQVETSPSDTESASALESETESDLPAASNEPAAVTPAAEPEVEPALAPGPVLRIVAKDGSGDHRSISAAIRASGYLDEIQIMPGTYRESVVIDRRISLSRGAGPGAVIIDGGAAPALTLDRVTMIEVSGLVLKGGRDAYAAVLVKQGQLKLSSCRMDASPGSAAAGASQAGAQLVLLDCLVRAGDGTSLAIAADARGALESCEFSWNQGNQAPFIDPANISVVTMKSCVFGRKAIEGPFLVSTNLLRMLPADGSPTLYVQPDRDQWPHWATPDETHFVSLALAADRAQAGSLVLVAPGTYRERVGIVRPLTISSTGSSGEVQLETTGESVLWINASGKVVLEGLSLRSSVGQSISAVQINGGQVDLTDCRIDNEAGHGLIVTSNHAISSLTMSGCRVFSRNKAVYATGAATTLELKDCLLAGEAIALFLVDGATAKVSNSTFDSDRYAVELWGPTASARLEGCTILRARQVLAFNEGASRSQVQTAGLIVK